MAVGPGKYDEAATAAREATGAGLVALIVVDGVHGHGFSIQTESRELLAAMPAFLRSVAAQIQGDIERDSAELALAKEPNADKARE